MQTYEIAFQKFNNPISIRRPNRAAYLKIKTDLRIVVYLTRIISYQKKKNKNFQNDHNYEEN